MKQSISISALLALSFAADPADFYRRRPMSLIGHQVERPIDVYDYDSIERDQCKLGAKAFDAYCHGRVNPHRYADFRSPDTGVCDYDDEGDIPAQIHCLAQQCMYEYCMWRRDQYVANCDSFVDDWDQAVADVGCAREGKGGMCIVLDRAVSFDLRDGT